jgi:hypothetical protein
MEAVLNCRLCMTGAANDPGAGHPHGGGENAATLQVQTIHDNLWTMPCFVYSGGQVTHL